VGTGALPGLRGTITAALLSWAGAVTSVKLV
jgi:hypothetical protein